jgi:hypothetical protein
MKVLVASAMRTGSTWVHEVLVSMIHPKRRDFVDNVEDLSKALDHAGPCVLKSHSCFDLNTTELSGKVHHICVLRNYKDSLISRALYCRNVRPAEGEVNCPDEEALIHECIALKDRAFVNVFLSNSPLLSRWLKELVVFEQGRFDHTFYYEMLLHNPRDQFQWWIERHGLQSRFSLQDLDAALDFCSFQRMRTVKTPGFMGSTGVGLWMRWLEEPLSKEIDRHYYRERELAREERGQRSPIV